MSERLFRLGERIRLVRKEKGLSQEQLADSADLHVNYVGAVERGEKNVTFESIEKIADALGVSLEEIFRFIDPIEKEDLLGEFVHSLLNLKPADREFIIKNAISTLDWKYKK